MELIIFTHKGTWRDDFSVDDCPRCRYLQRCLCRTRSPTRSRTGDGRPCLVRTSADRSCHAPVNVATLLLEPGSYYYYYYMRWRMPPFMRQCWGLQVGPMHETAGMGKLINVALLSLLMRRVWVYAVLPSSWVNSSVLLVCRHDRVTREVGRVGLVARDRGRRGYWVALYLYIYTARLLMSVFL